jgi:hypothetical protein
MTPQTKPQTLTTEELDALLCASSQTHLDPELTALRSVFTDLRAASSSASEHHQRLASITSSKLSYRPLAWTFAAAALLLCAGTPLAFHHHRAAVLPVAIVTPAPQPAPTVSDAVLYADIQADIDASVPEPMLPLSTDTSTQSTTQRNPQ